MVQDSVRTFFHSIGPMMQQAEKAATELAELNRRWKEQDNILRRTNAVRSEKEEIMKRRDAIADEIEAYDYSNEILPIRLKWELFKRFSLLSEDPFYYADFMEEIVSYFPERIEDKFGRIMDLFRAMFFIERVGEVGVGTLLFMKGNLLSMLTDEVVAVFSDECRMEDADGALSINLKVFFNSSACHNELPEMIVDPINEMHGITDASVFESKKRELLHNIVKKMIRDLIDTEEYHREMVMRESIDREEYEKEMEDAFESIFSWTKACMLIARMQMLIGQ